MKKSEAIEKLELNSKPQKQIHFSNINSSVNVWWLDIPKAKFNNKVYIILNDKNELHLLEIASLGQEEKKNFFVRKSNNDFQLEIISQSNKKFTCRKSNVNFKKYITRSKKI